MHCKPDPVNNKWLLVGIPLMLLSMFSCAAGVVEPTPGYQKALTATLDSLLSELNIPHDANLESMINASQVWRRKPGQERWELPELDIPADKELRAFELLEKLGLTTPISPAGRQYDYALFLGATIPSMKRRLDNLVHLWLEGVRFRRLIYLVGQRPIHHTIDHPEILASLFEDQLSKTLATYPFTETEAAIMLHQLAPMPADMRALPVEFIDTPRNWHNGYWYRPNTRDTLKHWEKTRPAPGSTLVISGQPYGNYQKEVVRQELREEFSVDLAAGPENSAATLVIYLDALALWLYNMK